MNFKKYFLWCVIYIVFFIPYLLYEVYKFVRAKIYPGLKAVDAVYMVLKTPKTIIEISREFRKENLWEQIEGRPFEYLYNFDVPLNQLVSNGFVESITYWRVVESREEIQVINNAPLPDSLSEDDLEYIKTMYKRTGSRKYITPKADSFQDLIKGVIPACN